MATKRVRRLRIRRGSRVVAIHLTMERSNGSVLEAHLTKVKLRSNDVAEALRSLASDVERGLGRSPSKSR